MSCLSNNFSSFFLNSLNDSSEFAKYLSNGELKFSSFEDAQAFGAGNVTQQQQQQQQQQQLQQLNGCGNNNNANNNNNINGSINSTNNNQHGSCNSNGMQDAIAACGGGPSSSGVEMFNGTAQHLESPNNYMHPSAVTTTATTTTTPTALAHHQHQHQHHQQQQQQQQQPHHHHHPHLPAHHPPNQHTPHYMNAQLSSPAAAATAINSFHHNHHQHLQHAHAPHNLPPQASLGYGMPQRWPTAPSGVPLHNNNHVGNANVQHFDGSFEFLKYLRHTGDYNGDPHGQHGGVELGANASTASTTTSNVAAANNCQQQSAASHSSSLIDLDSSTAHKARSSRKAAALLSSVSRGPSSLEACTLDMYDHDSKHTLFDLQHMTNSSNSNESSLEMSNLAFPSSHLNASNSNTSSEGAPAGNSDFPMLNSASNAPKPLASFIIRDNYDVHPAHKVEEGIFQHMNKLPPKKKENLKQLGVRFTGQMTLSDKSIVVENFIRFCQEYDIKDHRPFLSLNQSGLNKPEQIKFARYLGQGLPTFTLFCIYSNFKNLFCTKRIEMYTKDGYNLPYILDKTKRFLSNTTADLKNMLQQQSNDALDFASGLNGNTNYNNNSLTTGNHNSMAITTDFANVAVTNNNNCNNNNSNSNNNSSGSKYIIPKVLEDLVIYENFDVHETHRIEDGVCTHITRLPPKKQELLKQFGIQSNQVVTFYEKYIIIENFIKFCNEYKISDHRPFLDFHESGLPKCEQLKFVRFLGQGLPNLTLNKVYVAFKDVLGMNRIEKITIEGYNLELILKKKKRNLYNRMHAAGIL